MARKPRSKKERDQEKEKNIDRIVNNSEVQTTEDVSVNEQSVTAMEPYTVSLYPRHKQLIRAIAWHERTSQRQIIEKALRALYEDEEKIDAIKSEYRKNN